MKAASIPSASAAPAGSSGVPPGEGALVRALAAAAVVLLILAPTLLYPFGRDQSVFAYVGTVIARGGMPYRDAWELKPPGIYLLYSLLARLVPGAAALMAAVRVADVVLACAAGVMIAELARRWKRLEIAVAATAWFTALYFHGGYWSLAQAEAWANPLVLGAALLCLVAAGKKTAASGEMAAAGVLAGCTALLKFTAVLPLLPFVGFALWSARDRWAFRAGALLLGGLLPCAAVAAWLWRGGAWGDYLDVQRGFVAPYVRMSAPGPARWLANFFAYTLGWLKPLWAPALLAAVGLLLPRPGADWQRGWGKGWGRPLAALALLGGLAAVWAQGKYFLYHWESSLPWMGLLAAAGALEVFRLLRLPTRALPALGVLAALTWVGIGSYSQYRDACRVAIGQMTRDKWLERFGKPGKKGGSSFLTDIRAAEYVRTRTRAADPVLVWGFEPSVYLFSDRRPPTRYFFNVAVGVTYTPAAWRQQFLEDVARRPPELLLIAHHDAIPWANGTPLDSAEQLHGWADLDRWVRANYLLETSIDTFDVYRLVGRTHRRDAEDTEKNGTADEHR